MMWNDRARARPGITEAARAGAVKGHREVIVCQALQMPAGGLTDGESSLAIDLFRVGVPVIEL